MKYVITCDMAIFNFDGSDLPPGAVIEFMVAKYLDIPSILLRTDFRHAGDQEQDGDPWNLMASFYPRTRNVMIHGMQWYQEAIRNRDNLNDSIDDLYKKTASTIITELDAVRGEKPLPKGTPADIERLYQWAVQFPGGGLKEMGVDIEKIISDKTQKGLI